MLINVAYWIVTKGSKIMNFSHRNGYTLVIVVVIVSKYFIGRNLVAWWWWVLVGLQQLRQALTDILLLDCWEQSEGKERLESPLFSVSDSKGKDGRSIHRREKQQWSSYSNPEMMSQQTRQKSCFHPKGRVSTQWAFPLRLLAWHGHPEAITSTVGLFCFCGCDGRS